MAPEDETPRERDDGLAEASMRMPPPLGASRKTMEEVDPSDGKGRFDTRMHDRDRPPLIRDHRNVDALKFHATSTPLAAVPGIHP